MDYLDESIEKLRRENEFEKQEIVSYLDQLVQVRNDTSKSSMFNNPFKNTYITDLCKYEQQINHKLTEIKFELKKFVALNKAPICKPLKIKSDFDPIDIDTLKENSMRLISKLEEYSVKDENQLKSDQSEAISPYLKEVSIRDEVKFPYVSECTLEKLSAHTKCMLKDLSISKNLKQGSEKAEDICSALIYCGHFPEIQEKFPAISRSCSTSSMSTLNIELPTKNSKHFQQYEDKLHEIIRLCQIKLEKSKNSDSSLSSELYQNHNLEISSFLDDTLRPLNDSERDISNTSDKNCLIDLEVALPNLPRIIQTNLETSNTSSSKPCSSNYSQEQPVGNSEVLCSESKFGEEDCVLLDLRDEVHNKCEILDDNLKTYETSTDSESTKYFSIENEETTSSEEVYASVENMVFLDQPVEPMEENDDQLSETADLCDISTSSTIKLNNESSLTENDNTIPCLLSGTDNISHINIDYSIHSETGKLREEMKESVAESKESDFSKNRNFDITCRLQNNLAEDAEALEESSSSSTQENVKDCNLNANTETTLYTAQEKIMKLGLEDRMTRFEQTRQVAPLPDLRLQPSVTDNEKMNQLLKQGDKFEIKDRNIPNRYVTCVFSHVESPFEFYIHLDDEESKLIDCLNDLITQQFRKTTTPYRSKFEAFEKIGKFCCAYVRGEKTYYRAEVVDWLFEKETKIVLVQLVDYGNVTLVHFKHLRELTKEFSMLSKIAVKCYLPMLYPPGSTKTNLLDEWPMTTIEALRELGGLCDSDTNIFYKIFYVQKEGDLTGVDMYEEGDNELNTVGQLLIDLGHAVQIVLPTDDPMGVVSDDNDIERLEACDNLNEVVLGYDPKDEGRICKFTRKDGTCFKGKNCKLEHLQFLRGGYTTDHTLVFCSAFNEIKLPCQAEYIYLRFTVFLGASHYYINLLQFADSLVSLEKVMNDKRNCATYEQFKIMPAYGEIILVKHWSKRWLRGKVRHHSYDDEGNCAGVQVFMVDYGDIIDVTLKDIRQINPEYLELPFQAVECILYNYKARNDVDLKDMDKFFYDNMFFREFLGQVLGQSNLLLCLRVYHKDRDIGKILTEHGFLSEVSTQIFPSNNSIVIPG